MLTRSTEVLANTLDISIFLIGTILAKCKYSALLTNDYKVENFLYKIHDFILHILKEKLE